MTEKNDKVRITVDMSPEAYTVLNEMVTQTGRSKADIMRLGFAMMSQVIPALKAGQHVGIVRDGNKLDKEFLGII